ncbi:MAG: hypothetical protein ACXVZ3_13245 [Gaiellaceae bacterium]
MAAESSSRGTRGSALWGTGNRGGERSFGSRRGLVIALAGAFALSAPFAAFAGGGTPTKPSLVPVATKVGGPKAGVQQGTYVPPALLKQAQANGNQRLRVIIQASGGTNAAVSAFAKNGGADGGTVAPSGSRWSTASRFSSRPSGSRGSRRSRAS